MRSLCRPSLSTVLSLTFVAFPPILIASTVKSRFLSRLCLILIILSSDILYGALLLFARLGLFVSSTFARSLARSPRPLLAIRLGFSYACCLIALVLTSCAILDDRAWGNLQRSFPFWWTGDCRLPGLISTALIACDQCPKLDGYYLHLLASLGIDPWVPLLLVAPLYHSWLLWNPQSIVMKDRETGRSRGFGFVVGLSSNFPCSRTSESELACVLD